jgi:broad specificity phosphatase PhoE
MYTLDLIRHAESDWVATANASPVPLFGGRMNKVDLSEAGVDQAVRLGKYARGQNIRPHGFFSSPAVRARRTCKISAGAMGMDSGQEPRIMQDLQELDWGQWTGQPRAIGDTPQFKRQREAEGYDFTPPGGESLNMVRQRALGVLTEIVTTCPPGHYWIHTHRNVIKALVGLRYGWSAQRTTEAPLDVVSITRFGVVRGELKLWYYNMSTQ